MRHPQKRLFRLPDADLVEIAAALRDDAEKLRGKRIFLTGATGFFGKWLLGALAHLETEWHLGLSLTLLSRAPERFLELYPEVQEQANWSFARGDVATFRIAQPMFDFVLHAATDTLGIATSEQDEARAQSIVEGTARMIELARASGARMLNVSSGAVYGAAAERLSGAREDDFADAVPQTTYARAKRAAEEACGASGVNFVTARAFAFLGPHLPLDAHYAAGNFLRDAHAGGPILVRGDGTALRSYLYPTDLVAWLLRMMLRGERGRAYNVGSDISVSTGDLAGRIAGAGVPASEIIVQNAHPEGPRNIYLCAVSRARSELGLSVTVPLDEAIRRTLAWLRTR